MSGGKAAYLKKITTNLRWRTKGLGEKFDGSSPPSVFIGNYGYPKVAVGPMIAPYLGDTTALDRPEAWIADHKTQEEIISFRLDLIRGKTNVSINDFDNKVVQKIQEIALSKYSVSSEIGFKSKPKGFTLDEEHQPFGPSAELERFEIDPVRWVDQMEKAYYDTDLNATEAITDLYQNGVEFSQIQKALSTGSFGIKKNRKLVPTRWSITAADSALAKHYFDQVRYSETIEEYEVYEFSSLNNYYAVILLPTPWQYEWIEAFIHIMGKEEMIFADYEQWRPKTQYSSVGGCYYSAKFAVLESLAKSKRQAGAVILREAYEGYVPLGVFNVRENVKWAMKQTPRKFESFRASLNYTSTKLKLPISRFVDQGVLIRELLCARQSRL
ncbi:MAG: Nre family DNA repair protein [Candidatus Bilamarchaeum sp.]|jgi:hypothetical protein